MLGQMRQLARQVRPTVYRAAHAILTLLLVSIAPALAEQPTTADVIVYGGTSAGVVAAIQSADGQVGRDRLSRRCISAA